MPNIMMNSAAVLALLMLISATADKIPDEDWGYVDVRPSAYMFWWLYGCTNQSKVREEVPLVMWLQGGPGGSSTGFGNFQEIGPLDVDLKPRNTSWTQVANVLFVDNPVGTGYSYVDDDSAYTTDVDAIAGDLITLFRNFLIQYPIFETTPFYIFSESYGGKMAAAFALALAQAVDVGSIKVQLKGVALGDSWISPIDYMKTWGPYLYGLSLVNGKGLSDIQGMAVKAEEALLAGNYTGATQLWGEAQDLVGNVTDGVDWYNILIHNNEENPSFLTSSTFPRNHPLARLHADKLSALMNGPIKKKLNIPSKVVWGGQAGKVFEKQSGDFMIGVISTVEQLLTKGVPVIIYNGQLDLICNTPGTLTWMEKLGYYPLFRFNKTPRIPLYPPSGRAAKKTGAFLQGEKGYFTFFWIMSAGHMVPADAGEMAMYMLEMVLSN